MYVKVYLGGGEVQNRNFHSTVVQKKISLKEFASLNLILSSLVEFITKFQKVVLMLIFYQFQLAIIKLFNLNFHSILFSQIDLFLPNIQN